MKIILTLGSILLVNAITISPVVTEEVDLDNLCHKFPLNSRCQNNNFSPTKLEPKIYEFERDTFCTKFPFNSHCQQKPVEIIQLNLERSGEDDEWIHLKKIDSTIELSHRTKVRV